MVVEWESSSSSSRKSLRSSSSTSSPWRKKVQNSAMFLSSGWNPWQNACCSSRIFVLPWNLGTMVNGRSYFLRNTWSSDKEGIQLFWKKDVIHSSPFWVMGLTTHYPLVGSIQERPRVCKEGQYLSREGRSSFTSSSCNSFSIHDANSIRLPRRWSDVNWENVPASRRVRSVWREEDWMQSAVRERKGFEAPSKQSSDRDCSSEEKEARGERLPSRVGFARVNKVRSQYNPVQDSEAWCG